MKKFGTVTIDKKTNSLVFFSTVYLNPKNKIINSIWYMENFKSEIFRCGFEVNNRYLGFIFLMHDQT